LDITVAGPKSADFEGSIRASGGVLKKQNVLVNTFVFDVRLSILYQAFHE
jgi:hypothetical protein